MKLTPVQRQIMERMQEGAIIVPYGERLALVDGLSGGVRLIPQATMDAMRRRNWLVSIQFPGQRPMWFLSHLGREMLR